MATKNILIVEDDKNIARLIRYNLEKAGFECVSVITAEAAFEVLDRQAIDCVILDVMLPVMDGFEMLRQLKKDPALSNIPVIMLTAKAEEVDRVVGFELGADDYVVKPFSPRELILRLKSIFKRHKPQEAAGGILKSASLTVDIDRHTVSVDNKNITLTNMEFKLLVMLMKRNGRVQSRQQLLEDVWEMSADVTTRTIDTHIKRLRKKLGKAGKAIETLRGVGYRFKEAEQ